jgi:DNA-directed RNA polymerase specialized sigma24 family protein
MMLSKDHNFAELVHLANCGNPTTPRRRIWPDLGESGADRAPAGRTGLRCLRAALAQLSVDDRAVLILRHQEQLSAGKIAALLGVSQAESERRLLRALERLCNALANGVSVKNPH